MKQIKIDFVSDVSCPWCAIGLKSLEQALAGLQGEIQASVHFQPFELNPQMVPEGEEINEHLLRKYGATLEQLQGTRNAIRERGAALGFTFSVEARDRIYNSFDAHRLLHWAGEQGGSLQRDLKLALFTAYFTEGLNPGDHEVLVARAASVGLDAASAREVLESGRYAAEVRQREAFYNGQGIHSVPSVIVNDRHLIQGGQPPEVFTQALRQIAAQG
ncbi:DsbA family oxidoreductase [Pelomonas sp. SE-A7]|uniref:DsbA family oxidoreductase n=1 Tax=Pelomonas sp. SE-A7 TaxID=3054953 RepID=UPI00259D2AE6|nr:DsbA family oxidoreductase [Pelomonas sp. SE-A7]MDM4765417.1 DsbA family oxidoreductase [Pelomonas sp. SE-A7]